MDQKAKLEVAVEFAGFPPRERTLFSSLFKVSAGCDAFLNKPVQPQLLLRTLEKFLPDWRTG